MIKNTNRKMTMNSQLSKTKPKETNNKKTQANNQNRNRITEMEITWRVISGEKGAMGEKVQGIRSVNGRYKIDRGILIIMGNGEAKELTCRTHGHELRWGNVCGRGSAGQKGIKGRKKMG